MATRITWYGHATFGFETAGYAILIDPFFSGNPAAQVNPDTLKADFILITHGHHDHVGDTIAIAKRTNAMVISNFEIINWLDKMGIKNSHAQHIGGGFQYPFGYLKLTTALHGSTMPDGSNGGNPAGLLITTNRQKKLYFAGDTGLFGDMSLIGDEGIDLAALPIGDNYTMGPEDALKAVRLIRPKHVIPIHYNTWPLIAQDVSAWAERVAAETKSQVHVLKSGETFEL
jgi:L-ascorbate metabolism protein UlaG (beta-lactamase superfamily)